jgi:hypothetical protein
MTTANRDDKDQKIRHAVKVSIARSGKDRSAIAREMTARLDRVPPVTKHMLNDFTGLCETQSHPRFPLAWVVAFCDATGSESLARLALTPKLRALVELGECELEAQRQRQAKSGMVSNLLVDAKEETHEKAQ